MHTWEMFYSVAFCQICLTDLYPLVTVETKVKKMTSAMCDISVCCRLGRLKVKEAFRTFRDWLAVQLHIPASTFCHCCLNTATVESFPMSPACGPKGHFGKCNSYEDIKSHKNSYKFTIFYSCVRACNTGPVGWAAGGEKEEEEGCLWRPNRPWFP